MVDLKSRSNVDVQLEGLFNRYLVSISVSQIKKGVPRVNFKKIKLSKVKNLGDLLNKKNITSVYLDDSLLGLNLSFKREIAERQYGATESKYLNPLRKKVDHDLPGLKSQTDTQLVEEDKGAVTDELPFVSGELLKEDSEETIAPSPSFNLEAQISHDEENVIYSPSTVSLPPEEGGVISATGEQSDFIWPPPQKQEVREGEDEITKRKKKKTKKKSKSYFLIKEEPQKEKLVLTDPLKPAGFPWMSSKEDYEGLEDLYHGGLESELVDPEDVGKKHEESLAGKVESKKESKPEQLDKEIDELYKKQSEVQMTPAQVIFKAFAPNIPPGILQERKILPVFKDIKPRATLDKGDKVNFGVGKVEKMLGKFGGLKITPIRIIVYGGIAATIGYLIFNQFYPNVRMPLLQQQDDLAFKNIFKKTTQLKKSDNTVKKEEVDSIVFKPITESQRLALIQKAKESIAGRLDPFGQENVLKSIPPEKRQEIAEEKGPIDFPKQRKQVELVGIVSSKDKNLALVNVYTADYTLSEEDGKKEEENKLRLALNMAVPNRLEVSILDPVEDWNVNLISKSKSRSEDPVIELVKGDKKFKLKVGQKVLLPEEEKPEEELDKEPKTETLGDLSKGLLGIE